MTGKELKKMNHAELIEIIYQYEKRLQELTAENTRLETLLRDRQIQLQEAGSIAEASLKLNHIFETAQKAADEYMASIRAAGEAIEADTRAILNRAEAEAQAMKEEARAQCDALRARTEEECGAQRQAITDLLLLDSELGGILRGGEA